MATLELVDRFETIVTGAVTVGAPLSTANIALGNVTGLSATGLNSLEIYRADVGRVPTYVDTIYGWTSIVGLSLQAAVRTTGAALQAGDLVYCVFNSSYWTSLTGAYDTVVTTAAQLITALAPGSASRKIAVAPGTYSLAADIGPQSYQDITWGDSTADGIVTLDFGANNAKFRCSNTVTDYTGVYDPSNSFGVGAGGVAQVTRTAGVWDASIADGYKFYLEGVEYEVQARTSNTVLTLKTYPTSALRPLYTSHYMLCLSNPVRFVTMRGRLHLTGSGDYEIASLQGYGWDCQDLWLSAQTRLFYGTPSSPFFLETPGSHWGRIDVIGRYDDVSTAGALSVSKRGIVIRHAQRAIFDQVNVREFELYRSSVGTGSVDVLGVYMYYSQYASINVNVSAIRSDGTGGTSYTAYGFAFVTANRKTVVSGSIADVYGKSTTTRYYSTGSSDCAVGGLCQAA